MDNFDHQLKIRLENTRDGLIYQVIEMPEALRNMPDFVSSTGYRIASRHHPQLDCKSREIFIIGQDKKNDHITRLDVYYSNTEHRQEHYDDILAAFQELVKSDLYRKRLNIAKSPTQPNTYEFDHGRIVIRLEQARNGLIYQVLKMPEQLRHVHGKTMHSISVPSGIFRSAEYPEINADYVYGIGLRPEHDQTPTVFETLGTISIRHHFDRVLQIYSELVKTPEYQQLVHPVQDNIIAI